VSNAKAGLSRVVVQRLERLLRIKEILDSDLGQETVYRDWGFSFLPSVRNANAEIVH
jgi:hypothetical protein